MNENQKLREALQAISHIDDTTNHSVDASAALDRIGQIARQAIALPTKAEPAAQEVADIERVYQTIIHWDDGGKRSRRELARRIVDLYTTPQPAPASAGNHIPDAGEMVVDHFPDATKMIETAAPVGERERFEAWWRSVQLMTFPKEYAIERLQDWGSIYKPKALDAWQAALSAGDAVDAQRYRWLRDESWAGYNQCKGFPHVFTVDGAGNRRTMLAEEALDAAIDAALRKDKP